MSARSGWWLALALLASGVVAQEVKPTAPSEKTDREKPAEVKPAPSPSDRSAAPGPVAETQKALFAFAQAFGEAFNRHDAKAVAGLWSKSGVHTNHETGERTAGREAIEKVYADTFAADASKQIVVTIDNVRQITADVATADGAATVVGESGEPEDSTFSAVFVKQDGKWLLDSAVETNLPAAEKPYDHLQALEWMVGEWQDDSEDVEVHTNCKWSPNYAFLTRTYTIVRDGEVQHQGTQVIGWDPESETIRSWTFESDGAFGEGVWSQEEEDKWVIKLRGVRADGSRVSATQVLTLLDENTVTSQMLAREVAGEMLPSGDPVTVVRVEPAQE